MDFGIDTTAKVDEEQGSSLRREVNSALTPTLSQRERGKVEENRKISGSPAGCQPETFPSSKNSSTRRVGNDADKTLETAKNVLRAWTGNGILLVAWLRNYT